MPNEIVLKCIQTILYYFKNKRMPEEGPLGFEPIEPNLDIVTDSKELFCFFPCCCCKFPVPDMRICFDNKENRDLIFDYFKYWEVVLVRGRTLKEYASASDRFLITFRVFSPSFVSFQDSVPEYFRRMSREKEMQKYLASHKVLNPSSEEKTPLLAAPKPVQANPAFIDNDTGKNDGGTCMGMCHVSGCCSCS